MTPFPTYKSHKRARCFNCGSTLTDQRASGSRKGTGAWRGTCSGDRTQESMKRELKQKKDGDLTYQPCAPRICPYITWYDLGPKNLNTVVFEDDEAQSGTVYLPATVRRKKRPWRTNNGAFGGS